METKSVHLIYYSPAYSTRRIVRAVARGISDNAVNHDITQGVENIPEFTADDLVIIGVPSYSGRVPTLATSYLSQITAKGAAAILVCVYGNREYDDTLLELKNICIHRGFKVISAGAFIARHSIFPNIAKDRPSKDDLDVASVFGKKSVDFATKKDNIDIKVKGNTHYRNIADIPFNPKGDSKCNECGVCVKLCPVGAITMRNPRKTNRKLCISCARCIEVCPKNSRGFSGILYKVVRRKFQNKFSGRKEIELIYPE